MLEQLKARQIELSAQRVQIQNILNQAIADLQTINGAIRENGYWIEKFENEAKEGIAQ